MRPVSCCTYGFAALAEFTLRSNLKTYKTKAAGGASLREFDALEFVPKRR